MKRKKLVALFKCLRCCKKFPSESTRILHLQRKHFRPGGRVLKKCKIENFNKHLDGIKIKTEEIVLQDSNSKIEEILDKSSCLLSENESILLNRNKSRNSEIEFCESQKKEVVSKLCLKQIRKRASRGLVSTARIIICCLCKENMLSGKHICESVTKPKKCCICSKLFSDIRQLKRHLLTHLHGYFYMCAICKRYFKTDDTFRQHVIEHEEFFYTCILCNTHCKQKESFSRHFAQHHANSNYRIRLVCMHNAYKKLLKISCEFCGKLFKNNIFLRAHIFQAHADVYNCSKNSTNIFCKFCNKQFAHVKFLHTHISHFHWNEDSLYCKICCKQFELKTSLNRHVSAVHANAKDPFVCGLCNKHFIQKSHLRRHVLQVHQNGQVLNFKCNICCTEFQRKHNLNRHRNKFHTEFSCENCKKVFENKKLLETHKCMAQIFKQKEYLRVAKKPPGGESPERFSCEFCPQTFDSKSPLIKHVLKIHTDLGKLKFKYQTSLNRHIAETHENKNKSCLEATFVENKNETAIENCGATETNLKTIMKDRLKKMMGQIDFQEEPKT